MFLFARRDPPSNDSTPRASPMIGRASPIGSPHLRHVPSNSSLASYAGPLPTKLPKSVSRRVLLLTVAGLHVFLAAGVVFGWASLAEALAAEGMLCGDEEGCPNQAAAFAVVFTLGTVGNYTSNLPFGLLLDRYGPQRCCVCGALAQLAGSLLMVGQPLIGDAALYAGFFLLGFGGPGIQMATFHMAHLFPKHSGSLIAGSTALFDAGSAIFAIFYQVTRHGGVSLTSCWLAYTLAVLGILASGALLWPPTPFEAQTETDATATNTATNAPERSIRQQLTSRPFLYLVCFAAVHIMRLNFVVATFQQQLASLGFDDVAIEDFVGVFGALLPLGFVGMPLIGHLLDHRPTVLVFALVNIVGTANNVLLLLPNSRVALWGAMALVAVGRQFVYSTFFAQLQRFASPNAYGLMAGVANLCVASTGVLQPLLVNLSTQVCAGLGLFSFAPVNLIMIALVLLLFTQPLRCWRDRPPQPPEQIEPPVASSIPPHFVGVDVVWRGSPSTLKVALLRGQD
jgi:MFS family permease